MHLTYQIKETDNYPNINSVLINQFHLSTRLLSTLIKKQCIMCNHQKADSRNPVKPDDIITVDLSYEENNSNIVPTKMDLSILYEDEWMLIIDKPAGIAVHPSMLHFEDSLSNGIRYYFDSIGLKKKIRPVNRLDLNTSGIVIFAKCEFIQQNLSMQMTNHTFEKIYLAIIEGFLPEKKGTIELPIARKPNSIIERCVDFKNGQKSITHYKVLKEWRDKNYSLIKCHLETGRTHQIRVHFSAIGHPLVGDTLYGNPSSEFSRQALHCYELKFIHPITKKNVIIKSPLLAMVPGLDANFLASKPGTNAKK